MQDQSLEDRLLEAALIHVPFDGWSDASLMAAAQDLDIAPELARSLFPRGPVDLALAYHRAGDAEMARRFAEEDTSEMRYSDKVARAIEIRLELADKELVRRGAALFALPIHAGDGAKAVWGTVDTVWTLLGDTSEDVNWYTKRMTLSGVYSSTVLYWLGDDSPDMAGTKDFLARRIANVMAFEKTKSRLRDSPLGRLAERSPLSGLAGKIRKPATAPDLPGSLHRRA